MAAQGLAALAAALQFGPMVSSVAPLRRAVFPRLAGVVGGPEIALTYDDGPDPKSTPRFLELLDRENTSATFFLLGCWVSANALLVRQMVAAGHELAVHGWDHQCLVWKPPGRIADELRRTKQTIEDITGRAVTRFRPPYGVLTGESLLAARRAKLDTVLWSAWGRDWRRRATAASIVNEVRRTVRPGGTVLLHDTDRTSAPGSWLATLAASEQLLAGWAADHILVGSLADREG